MAFSFVLNHLLDADPRARERLAPFAGEVVELRVPVLPSLFLSILETGRVAAGEGPAALTIEVKPHFLAELARGKEHALKAVEVSGNARLASEVMALARDLRWDAEEDLSRVVGDVAAHRIARTARGFAAWQVDIAGRLGEALRDYLVDENPVLTGTADLEAFAASVRALRDAVERLDKRVARLA
ncbi:MAG TPA: SCP2 sterol-binding domain-containing protein [Burkholderiales bacterium]|nr:SCP2 sterol-binding domain-containing protein [Burkholderiales bacterium]